MAYILFSDAFCGNPYIQQECLFGKIRLSIFLIIGQCVGLPAVVWVLRFLYYRYKTGSCVSAFIITHNHNLCDLLVLLLNQYIVTKLLREEKCLGKDVTCHLLSSFWVGSILSGIHIKQVVALEAALLLRYPFHFARVFFPSCSIIIAIILFIVFFLCDLLWEHQYVFFAVPFLIVVTSISWIVTCKSPLCISNTPYRPRRPSLSVLAFVTLTLILYVTFSSTCAIMYASSSFPFNLFVMDVSLMSLNVILDPLLCVIIYRKSTELNQSEVNTQ